MLNNANKNIALAIARAYCEGNETSPCAQSLFYRLNNFLDDQSFQSMLSTLTSRRFAVGEFSLPMTFVPVPGKYLSRFSVMDLINGNSSAYSVAISSSDYNPAVTDWKKTIESVNRPYLKFEKVVGNKILFSSNEHGGYEIAYVSNPISGGGSGGSGGGNPDEGGAGSGHGQIIVGTENGLNNLVNPPAVVPVQNVFSGLDVNSLLIPGAVLLGLYFFMKR